MHISVIVNMNMWKKKSASYPFSRRASFPPHFLEHKSKFSRAGSSMSYLHVEPIEHGKWKNKPRMLCSYSSPQCFEVGRNYPGFTNEAAGSREMKPVFLGSHVQAASELHEDCCPAPAFCCILLRADAEDQCQPHGCFVPRPSLTLCRHLAAGLDHDWHSVCICYMNVLSQPNNSLWLFISSW